MGSSPNANTGTNAGTNTNASSCANNHQSFGGRLAESIHLIDKQVPSLTYMGLGFWSAWNIVAFSGAFWYRDIESSLHVETLIMVHLLASVVTLLACFFVAQRKPLLLVSNTTTWLGSLIATVGTVLIVITREAFLPSLYLFVLGGILSGIGTSIIFIRGVTLYGALPPRHAFAMFCVQSLIATFLFFMMHCCWLEFACLLFVLLPTCAAFLLCLHSPDTASGKPDRGSAGSAAANERSLITTKAKMNGRFALFIASVLLLSCAFEIVRSYAILNVPVADGLAMRTSSEVIDVFLLLALLFYTVFNRDARNGYLRMFKLVTLLLILALAVLALLRPTNAFLTSFVSSTLTILNTAVWAMMAYIVFTTKANAIQTFALGNAALAGGSALGAGVLTLFVNGHLSEQAFFVIVAFLIVSVLLVVVFVLTEQLMDSLLDPLDEETLKLDEFGAKRPEPQAKVPRQWIADCEKLAETYGLSKRETEVMIAVARGMTAQQIADREVLSVYTVRAHIRTMYGKLNVHSKKELNAFIEENRQ